MRGEKLSEGLGIDLREKQGERPEEVLHFSMWGRTGMIWIVVVGMAVFFIQIITIVLLEYRRPAKAVAWLMISFVLPLIGFVLYYFLAREYKQWHRVRDRGSQVKQSTDPYLMERVKVDRDSRHPHRLFGLLRHIPASPITHCNETIILTNAVDTYEAILKEIERAKDHIHFEYYTIRSDGIGRQFQQQLMKKAQQGVKVRVIYDGLGSYKLQKEYIRELHGAGVETHCFLPPLKSFFEKKVNYRNHRKIVVIDGLVGYIGGINIGDEYLGNDPKLGFWRDTHVQIRGDAVFYLQRTFIVDWAFVSGQQLIEGQPDETARIRYYPEHHCPGNEQVQIISSGPDTNWEGMFEMYFAAMTAATERVYITSPYFIPDRSIGVALKTAAISGVDVKVIIPGQADSRLLDLASLSFVEELLQAGVKFYQYQKGFMHAKVMIVDRVMAVVGTANMDMRSFFSNFELNAAIFDLQTLERLLEDFQTDLLNSKPLMLSEFNQRSRYQRCMEVMARLLSPLL